MNGQNNIQRSYSVKHQSISNPCPSLPSTFISSLRQLFSILDKTNSGSVPFVVFKRYFDTSSSTFHFLNDLEIESNANDNLITFPLLIHVIERAITTVKSPPQTKRSSSTLIIPDRFENAFNPLYSNLQQQRIDFPMIRALKRFEIERDLLIQTSETIERVKWYLNERLTKMKEKQKSYCRSLSTAEATGTAIASMYNRDLVADLLKLANTVLDEAQCDTKKLVENCALNNQLKSKDDQIKRLEIEKRLLLKELVELRHEQGTVIPKRNS